MSSDSIAAKLLARVSPLAAVEHPVSECLGRVLASSVFARTNVPPWPAATRDGYAVRAADTIQAKPAHAVRLRVACEAAADSRPQHPLSARCAFRVMTGAPVPAGADAVVPAEWCCSDLEAIDARSDLSHGSVAARDWVEILRPVDPGQFVALTGAEFEAGSQALPAGTILGPPELAVLAALGQAQARVVPRPRVAIVATGTELSWQAGAPPAGKVHASNVALAQSMITACGAAVSSVRVTSDDARDVANALMDAIAADLILTTGGTGRSARDIVGKVLLDQEVDSLWNVPVRGSKPVAFRLLRDAASERLVPHLALPGRPIAVMVGFILFAYPLLRRLSGLTPNRPCYRWARLAAAIDGNPGHHRYIPVHLKRCNNGWEAMPRGESSLYGLAATARSDGFAVLGRRTGRLTQGHRVRILLPPWRTE